MTAVHHVVHKVNGDWYCHCATRAREHVCPLVVLVGLYLNEVTTPVEFISFSEMKRKPGRPGKGNKYGPYSNCDFDEFHNADGDGTQDSNDD